MTAAEVRLDEERTCPPGTWAAFVGERGLEVSVSPTALGIATARTPGGAVVLDGEPYIGHEVAAMTAEAVLARVLDRGTAALADLGGFFSFVVRDARDGSLTCARDPLGIHPLFWARTPGGIALAPTVEALLAQPEVPRRVDRVALADHLRHRWPRPEETFFEGVRRVLPGHWLRISGTSVTTERYWDPLFPGRHPEWVQEDELGRFDELFDRAVARLVDGHRTAIFLSGGLDSVSVGAVATDRLRRSGAPVPRALSLRFPFELSEAPVQAGVAAALGIPQSLVELEEALQGRDLVRAVLQGGAAGAPTQNPWLPAYRWLASRAAGDGADTVLTGSGGDEWLTVTPLYAADLIRSGQVRGLVELGRTQARSLSVSPLPLARNLLWRFGVRPLLVHRRDALLRRFRPEAYERDRFLAAQRSLQRRPWLAPDAQLRAAMRDRDLEAARRPPEDDLLPLSGPREYFRECRAAITHPLTSMEAEEVYEYSRGVGTRVVHPYWDTRLVEFLHATPPELLSRGGRSKGLVRHMLAQRFPDLGFERQRKLISSPLFNATVHQQAPVAWRELGGARELAALGVVDLPATERLYDDVARAPWDGRGALPYAVTDPLWEVLNAESWLRGYV